MKSKGALFFSAAVVAALAVAAIHPSADAASKSTLLQCASRATGWSGAVDVEESGVSTLFLRHGAQRYRCELRVSSFNLSPKAQVPMVWLEFDRGKCSPAIAPAKLDKEIQTHITLKLTQGSGAQPYKGLLQWLRYAQPSDCAVKPYNRDGMRSAYERWQNKTWGR